MTKGVPLTYREFRDHKDLGKWMWKDIYGRIWTPERFADDHLQNLERYLMGRGDLKLPSKNGPDNPAWKVAYDIVRDEIDRRGLELHPDDHRGAHERHPAEESRDRYDLGKEMSEDLRKEDELWR